MFSPKSSVGGVQSDEFGGGCGGESALALNRIQAEPAEPPNVLMGARDKSLPYTQRGACARLAKVPM